MADRTLEIICTACGADTLVRREPRFEGFKKVGERLLCASCGHEFASEAEVPFKQKTSLAVFGAEDKSREIRVFRDDEKGRTCRHCAHYVVNPFTQRCGRTQKIVQATDSCEDFKPKASADEEKDA
jgi:rRNA maturation protein Nop10